MDREPISAAERVLDLPSLALAIAARRRGLPRARSLLVALTGIDGAGKGFVAAELERALLAHDLRAAVIGADGWLDLPARRLAARQPAAHFYRHAFRYRELFDEVIEPLRARRSLRVEAQLLEETADAFHPRLLAYDDLDVILLEGIFLLRRELRARHDFSVWVDCTLATALERAIARAQEGLAPAKTERVYRTLYFPAQELHFELDRPRDAADAILRNDPRLGAGEE